MKKFIKICKAILPRCFRVAHWHLSFCWLQTVYFPMFLSLESHAVQHYICILWTAEVAFALKYM